MSNKKCRNCKHYQPGDSGLTGRCLHPRFGGHPAVRGGLVVSADELLCAKTDLYLWERRSKQMQFAHPEILRLGGSGDHLERRLASLEAVL